MIDLQEIEDEIARLEHGKTTYSACEKLSILYAVQDRMKRGEEPAPVAQYSFAASPSSEFIEVASAAPIDGLLRVLDEHMESIQILYPKEYSEVLRRIKTL